MSCCSEPVGAHTHHGHRPPLCSPGSFGCILLFSSSLCTLTLRGGAMLGKPVLVPSSSRSRRQVGPFLDTACHTCKAGRQPACRQWARCCAVSKTRQGDGRQTAEVQGYRGWGSGCRIQSLLQSGRPALDLNHLVVVPAEQAAWWSENKLRTETARAPPHLTPELCSPAPLGRAGLRHAAGGMHVQHAQAAIQGFGTP